MTFEQRVKGAARAMGGAFVEGHKLVTASPDWWRAAATLALASSEKVIAELEARIARLTEALQFVAKDRDYHAGYFHEECQNVARAAIILARIKQNSC
jgi:hypothetical protein